MQELMQGFFTHTGNLQGVPPQGTAAALQGVRRYYEECTDPGSLSFILFKMVEHIMKSKQVPEHTQQLYEQCACDVIDRAIDSEFKAGSEALRFLLDTSMEYYKHHSLDPSLRHPLGVNRKLNYYQPEVGEQVDVVKPYITSTSYCAWTRATLLARQGKKYTLKYANTDATTTVTSQPFFDLPATRTQDHAWRDGLQFGSLVDAYNKYWYPATVVEVGFENGARRVRVSFRRFCENGKKVDSDGNRYEGLGPNEDDWIDIYSCRIQRPGKMARELCEYSFSSEELIVDDTYDLLFEKEYEEEPFAAIMRCTYTRSLSYLHFYQHFWKRRGHEVFMQALKRRDLPIDTYINIFIMIGNSCFLVPRMGVQRHLPHLLSEGLQYLKQQHKQFNPMRLDAMAYFIDCVSKRIYSLSRKHTTMNEIRRFIVQEYLKLNLEKQMIALRYLFELIKPARPYPPEERQELNAFLVDNQIFYRVVYNNVHEQILSRSGEVVRYMLEQGLAGWPEIEHIWAVVPHSDLRGRATVERLLGELSKDFPFEFTAKLLDKLLTVRETELTVDKLQLVRVLKDRQLSVDYKVKILNYLWELLTVKATIIKQQVEEEAEAVFRGFISTLKEGTLKLEVLKAILQRLREITTVRSEMYLFKEFILTYPTKHDPNEMQEEGGAPRIIRDVVDFLKKEQIYEVLLRLLAGAKAREKIESILELIQFLFQRDRDDISSIVQAIYEQLGPTDVFLLWAKSLTSRATAFFVSLFQNPTNMQKFEKISLHAMEALKSILLDINVSVGNIRVLKKRKVILVPVGPLLPGQTSIPNTVPTNTTPSGGDDYSVKPNSKGNEQVCSTFVYVLKPPFECIGVTFLLQLCQYLLGSAVYNDVIKLIIQFIVSLDDSIADQAAAFREDFLSKIFQHIAQVAASNELGNAKTQLDIYVHLIQELLAETERDGLSDTRPHFSTIQGEVLRLKVENNITGNEVNKKEPTIVQINENCTFWELKLRLAEVYSEPVSKIDVVKYVNPIEDTNNGKAITDLHFFNEESIKATRREPREIPRHELVTHNNKRLSARFEAIVEKWFADYQEGGLLNAQGLSRLSSENWRGSIFKEMAKVQQVVNRYDLQKQGGITLGHFKDFFLRKAQDNLLLVWRLLNLSGYLNNLRHKEDPPAAQPPSSRRLLSTRKVYDTIFQVLSCQGLQAVHLNFYKLLVMLQTDQQLCRWVKGNIREFLQGEKCIYRLSYGLQSLTNQLDSNLPLYAEFYHHGGQQEIASKLQSFFADAEKSLYSFDTSLKTIVIPNLLKILNSYVYPLTAQNRMVRFFKKVRVNHLDMPQIIKKLQSPESFGDPQEQNRAVLLNGPSGGINVEQLYNLALRILQNLTKNFNLEYLVRLTHEIIRLFGYLSFAHPGYSAQHLFACANSGSLNIRRAAHALIYLQLLQRPGEAFDLLEKLVKNIPQDCKYSNNSYFELIKCVLERTFDITPDNQTTTNFLTSLSLHLFDLFFQSPNEPRQSFMASRVIEGILQNLLIIVQKRPSVAKFLRHFREKLVEDCLFFYDVRGRLQAVQVTAEMLVKDTQIQHFSNYVKCKTESSRKLLMELIYLLYQQSQPCDYFFERFLLPVLIELPDNARRTSARVMHVGLNNLGSTCYMNSMLQVLNTIDPFRNALMRTHSEAPLVAQLQALFSYLFFSERLDYVPRELLNAFEPPINPSIQQDTTEFLNFLFDRLEPRLKETPFRRLLQELFQGSQVAQMICHACGAKREREETFFSYSVEIDGKYDLQSALDGMHTGQLISDCLCESCGARSDTTKRNVLKEVPNIFFIHLKRIVFDYNLFINTKIHSRLFFPEEINYEPFTKEGLELREALGVEYLKGLKDNEEEGKKFEEQTLHGRDKNFYKLNLKGIIVHSGTPDVGHYYSIIKKSNGWIKFDDSRVTSFPISFFDDQCYGGTFVADQWGGSASSKNAYVLVYEKELRRDIEIEEPQQDGSLVQKILPEKELGAIYNTVEWYKQVWLDNHSLMLEQHLTADNYSREFLAFIGKMLELTPSPSTIRIISEVFFKISALSGEVGNLLDIFHKHLSLIDAEILDRYILSDPKRTFGLLFHQQAKVRDFASSYIQRVLLVNYTSDDVAVREKVIRFIHEYFNALHGEVAKNWLRIDGYFKMFEKLVEGSLAHYELYTMFVGADLITCFIDFIMEKQSPINIVQKKYSLGTKSNPVAFGSGLNIILFLLKRSFGFVGNNYEVPQLSANQLFHLTDNAVCCLSSMAFYQKMIKEDQNPFAIASIIERLCILNLPFSMAIARVLLKVFNENTDASDECDTVMLCISRVLGIKDLYWRLRAEAILGYGTCYVFDKNLMVTIEEEKYVYPSTLDNIFPLESLLSYIHINRQRVPLTVLNMIRTLLESTSCSEQAMDYIIQQPAPSYIHLRYIDWLRPYVNDVLGPITGLSDKKRQDAVQKVSLCNLYLDDLYRRIEKMEAQLFVMVIGEIRERVLTDSFTDPNEQVSVNIYQVPFFGVESLPNGKSNSIFQSHLTNGRLETLVSDDSNILKFFKQSCKPLAIKAKNVQEAEDKQLMSLFDEDPNPPKKTDKGIGTQSEGEAKPEEKPLIAQGQPIVLAPSQPLQPIQQIVPLEIKIESARLIQDYMQVIEITSKHQSSKYVQLNITGGNANLPRCLRFMVGKSKEEYYFHKTQPYDPLGKVEYHLTVAGHIDNPKPFFRTYGHSYASPPPEPVPVPEEQAKEERKQMEVEGAGDFGDQDQIGCPVCTFFNAVTNTHCEICGSALNEA